MKNVLLVILSFFLLNGQSFSQDNYVPESQSKKISPRECKSFTKRASKKCDKLTSKLRKSTNASLAKVDVLEDKIFHSLCSVNEGKAESLMRGSIYSYRWLEDQIILHGDEDLNSYVPEMDSLCIFTTYLEEINADKTQVNDCECSGLDELKKSQHNLKRELKRSEIVDQYIKERNAYLHKAAVGNENAQKFLPSFEKLNYYNNKQVQEYLSLFADRSKPEKLLSGFLNSMPGFSQFANLNGSLAGFNSAIPSNTSVASLQTKEEVYALMNEAIANNVDKNELLKNLPSGLDIDKKLNNSKEITSDFSKSSDNAKNLSNDLKQNVESIEQAKDSLTRENRKKSTDKSWKPNPLKTKRFVDRLQYGLNMQADPSTRLFPTTASILGQVSFQLSTNMNVGLGTSFMTAHIKKIGVDQKGIGTIATNGYALRSFYDFKIKGNVYLQMNYEWNFRNTSGNSGESNSIKDPLFNTNMQGYESWLAGLKLKTGSSKKRAKTVEMLYDFRHKQTGQPSIQIRFGIEIKPKHSI